MDSAMKEKIRLIIEHYKMNFDETNEKERYKWEAIKCYKDNWNINAPNFALMLTKSFSKAENLLDSFRYYPHKVLLDFANAYPEDVRGLFRILHDETLPLDERLEAFADGFAKWTDELKSKNKEGKEFQSYQDIRAMMVYLTFQYPEKYFFFKSSMYETFKDRIGYIEDKTKSKVNNYNSMCEIILEEANNDIELIEMSKARLDNNCYKDEKLHLLTMDIVYFGYAYDVKELGWLLTWNPANWEWKDFDSWCERTKKGENTVLDGVAKVKNQNLVTMYF